MQSPRDIRRLEVEAELSKLHAAQCEARAKAAVLEVERSQLGPLGAAQVARSGITFVGVLVIALAAALVGAVLTSPATIPNAAAATGAR